MGGVGGKTICLPPNILMGGGGEEGATAPPCPPPPPPRIDASDQSIWRVLSQNELRAIFDIFKVRAPLYNTK